ncbi:MAG: DUF4349 domain-containing protein [Candidatus Nanohaloarchaea archaeon]
MMDELRSTIDRRHLAVVAILGLTLMVGGLAKLTSTATGDSVRAQQDLTAAGGAPISYDAGSTVREQSAETERKKVTRYRIELEVPDVEKAMDQTGELAKTHGGYTTSSSFSREDGNRGSLEVAVPQENVSAFLGEVRDTWRVESSERDTEDVTDRYTELKLELKNKRQELNRLEEMMNETDSVDSLIKIQERMSELRSRIQYLENQLNQLDRKVEYTRIHLSYEEPKPLSHEFEIRESLRQGYRGIFQSLDLMIVGLGYLLPFLLLGGIIYKGRNLWRERNRSD